MKKRIFSFRWMVPSLALAILISGGALFAANEGIVSVTGQGVRGDPDASNKFKEYQTVPDGVYLDEISLKSQSDGSGRSLEIKGRKVGLDDQTLSIEGGKTGVLKVGVRYDQTPHIFSTTGKSLYVSNGNGYLGLSNQLQTDLQTSTNNATASFSDVPLIPLQLRRDSLSAFIQAGSMEGLSLQVSASQENRNGSHPIGVAFGHGTLVEVPEPIQYKTKEISAVLEMNQPGLSTKLSYGSSFFINEIDALTVDYVWRSTSSAISASGSSTPDKGSLGLPPDNQAHHFSLQTGVDLPFWASRWNSSVSYGWIEQDDKFLPMTVNPNIISRAAALGLPIQPPSPSLSGKVKTWNANSIISLKPFQIVSVKGKVSYYDYKNQTAELKLDQYVQYDTSLSTATPKLGFNNVKQRKSLSTGYSKLNAGGDATYQILKDLDVTLGYLWERINRKHRETKQTDEHGASLAFDYRFKNWITLRPSVSRSNRYYDHYNAEEVAEETFPLGEGTNALGQLPLLRKVDQAQRLRDIIGVKGNFDPFDSLSIGAEYSYRLDDYYGSEYGTQKELNHSYSLEVLYEPFSRLSLSADYSREENVNDMRSRYRESGTTTRLPFDKITSDWIGRIEDETDTYGAGANISVIENKLDWDAQYSLSRSKGEMSTYNPYTIVTDAAQGGGNASSQLSGATVSNYPTTKTELHKISSSVKWNFAENLTARLSYLYERYMVTDFAFDDIQVWQATWNQSVFLDAGQGNYDAHVVGLSMVYKF